MDKFSLFKECIKHPISTDTRNIKDDNVFIALKGDNFNGNEYCQLALKNGAAFCISDDEKNLNKEGIYVVEDGLKFLQELAHYKRQQLNIPVIGITGSNGKTTNKELIHTVLSKKYSTSATKGNLNNHIGVPLTLMEIAPDTEVAIVEMGANQPNDIIDLAEIAEPNHALITNIGAAHLEGFGNLQGVLKTKKQLFDFIERSDQNTVVFNANDRIIMDIVPSNVQKFGFGPNEDLKMKELKSTPFLQFSYEYKGYHSPFLSTHLVGDYNINNFMAAISFGILFDIPFDQINNALEEYTPSNNRSQLTITNRNQLIVDCYNANPTSMAAAVKNMAGIDRENRLCILGDMLEMGKESSKEHQNIIELIDSIGLDAIYVGDEFNKEAKGKENFYLNTDTLIDSGVLKDKKDSLVLLKGSRGIKLERLIDYL